MEQGIGSSRTEILEVIKDFLIVSISPSYNRVRNEDVDRPNIQTIRTFKQKAS